jgi:hypothetical protein
VRTRYRKVVRRQRDIESNCYSNGSPNKDLESEFKKYYWDALRAYPMVPKKQLVNQ